MGLFKLVFGPKKCKYRGKCGNFTVAQKYCTGELPQEDCGIYKRFNRGEINVHPTDIRRVVKR
jgi:hypothetical protein